jgi:hypothetical protein
MANRVATKLEGGGADVDSDDGQMRACRSNHSNAAMIDSQWIRGIGWARSQTVNDVESRGKQTAHADRVCVVPRLCKAENINRSIMKQLEYIIDLAMQRPDVEAANRSGSSRWTSGGLLYCGTRALRQTLAYLAASTIAATKTQTKSAINKSQLTRPPHLKLLYTLDQSCARSRSHVQRQQGAHAVTRRLRGVINN